MCVLLDTLQVGQETSSEWHLKLSAGGVIGRKGKTGPSPELG